MIRTQPRVLLCSSYDTCTPRVVYIVVFFLRVHIHRVLLCRVVVVFVEEETTLLGRRIID